MHADIKIPIYDFLTFKNLASKSDKMRQEIQFKVWAPHKKGSHPRGFKKYFKKHLEFAHNQYATMQWA